MNHSELHDLNERTQVYAAEAMQERLRAALKGYDPVHDRDEGIGHVLQQLLERTLRSIGYGEYLRNRAPGVARDEVCAQRRKNLLAIAGLALSALDLHDRDGEPVAAPEVTP